MKVMITGGTGMLGIDLATVLAKDNQVLGLSRQNLDVTNLIQVKEIVHQYNPDVIIHTAAYTQVDQAEKEIEAAFNVNAYGTRNMALAASQVGAKMIYLSTDYVFDGRSRSPYKEFEQTNPQNVYGKSKLFGEEMVKAFADKFFIVRTSWLFGMHGKNSVKTMLKLAEDKKEIHVVYDQVGCPTYTLDLSLFINDLISTENYGIYHASNTGSSSWYELENTIYQLEKIEIKVHPVETILFPLPAARPAYSVLDHMSIRLNRFNDLRHWTEALEDFSIEMRA
jgi:dTDP-4-dehydrorhamnose reductase